MSYYVVVVDETARLRRLLRNDVRDVYIAISLYSVDLYVSAVAMRLRVCHILTTLTIVV